MSPRRARPRPPEDEIEILEVVSVGDDMPPPSVEEVEVTFGTVPAAPAAPAATAREAEELRERHLRLLADFDNYKKRAERERHEHIGRASEDLVSRLLPIVDNLERALAATGSGADALRSGLELIHRQLWDELRREGLRPVEALGHPFDPNLHDAVATVRDSGQPPDTVVAELQRGYFFRDRLVRPALVRVQTDPRGEEA